MLGVGFLFLVMDKQGVFKRTAELELKLDPTHSSGLCTLLGGICGQPAGVRGCGEVHTGTDS